MNSEIAEKPSASAPDIEAGVLSPAIKAAWLEGKEPPKTEEPAPQKPEETSATTDEKEASVETAAASDPAKVTQEKSKKTEGHAGTPKEERVKELLADRNARDKRIAELEKLLSEKSPTKQDPAPEKKAAANYGEWKESFDPDAWMEKWQKDNPEASFGKTQLALSEYLYEVRKGFEARDQFVADLDRKWKTQISDLEKLYPEVEGIADKVNGAAERIAHDPEIPVIIKQYTADSEVIGHLLYALTTKQLDTFIELSKSNPRKALAQLRDLERETEQLLEAEKKPKVEAKKETPAPPETPAHKPPAEVGGRGTPPEDSRFSAAKEGNFQSFKAEQERRLKAGLL